MCGNARFLHGCLGVSCRSWHKSKNPCSCGNRTFPNLVHHQNLESILPAASYAFQAVLMHFVGKVWFLHGHGFLLFWHSGHLTSTGQHQSLLLITIIYRLISSPPELIFRGKCNFNFKLKVHSIQNFIWTTNKTWPYFNLNKSFSSKSHVS